MHNNQHALELFLRRGIHLDVFEEYKTDADFQAANTVKETRDQHSTPYYVWRTTGDDRVRASHAVNNGQIFSWDIPPTTGHPGEDYNCRCWAEPYDPITAELYNRLIKPSNDRIQAKLKATPKWTDKDMSLHFYTGNGSGVTLSQIGHLKAIQSLYQTRYLGRFEAQIQNKALELPDGSITDKFKQSYDFGDVLYSHGKGSVLGKFEGNIFTLPSGKRIVKGIAHIQFLDWFSDPINLRQWRAEASPYLASSFLGDGKPLKESELSLLFQAYSEVGGHPYPVIGNWDVNIQLVINP